MTNPSEAGQLRRAYRGFSNQLSRITLMVRKEHRPFGREVLASYVRHILGVNPIRNGQREAADAAVAWLLRAQAATPDDGVSHGYFPTHWDMGWRRSYPETTGYIIPSLIAYAAAYGVDDAKEKAIAMAHWESDIQMASGAVQGGPVCPSDQQRPAVFNTGMVLQGWTAAWRETANDRFLDSGRRAAEFLAADMDEDGHYRSHGGFVTQHKIKTYNVLCSWALYRLGEDTDDATFKEAAVRNGEATLGQQNQDGWFGNCCLTNPEAPLTHTIGYAMQGLLELGVLSGREDFVRAVEKASAGIIANVGDNGYLPARLDSAWRKRARYSCLTGSAQIAIVLYRLFELRGESQYLDAANRLLDYVKATQTNDSGNDSVNGAIAGSYPILGAYMTAGYPNWATKYFLDALMLQDRLSTETSSPT